MFPPPVREGGLRPPDPPERHHGAHVHTAFAKCHRLPPAVGALAYQQRRGLVGVLREERGPPAVVGVGQQQIRAGTRRDRLHAGLSRDRPRGGRGPRVIPERIGSSRCRPHAGFVVAGLNHRQPGTGKQSAPWPIRLTPRLTGCRSIDRNGLAIQEGGASAAGPGRGACRGQRHREQVVAVDGVAHEHDRAAIRRHVGRFRAAGCLGQALEGCGREAVSLRVRASADTSRTVRRTDQTQTGARGRQASTPASRCGQTAMWPPPSAPRVSGLTSTISDGPPRARRSTAMWRPSGDHRGEANTIVRATGRLGRHRVERGAACLELLPVDDDQRARTAGEMDGCDASAIWRDVHIREPCTGREAPNRPRAPIEPVHVAGERDAASDLELIEVHRHRHSGRPALRHTAWPACAAAPPSRDMRSSDGKPCASRLE